MAEQLTKQQEQAIINRGGKLLVSAAAGSGKTKVLVDRLMGYLMDPVQPANLDDFLIITYTKAAAAELRGKIAEKLTERIALNPENRHLQQQMQRLYLTKISTVHSFCADILREYAYRLDISGDFRVADENECLELQARVMQNLLEDSYAELINDPDFRSFVDSQGFGRDDRQIPEILLKVYYSAKCHLDPDGWLDWCTIAGGEKTVTDASQTVWGKYLIDDLHNYLDMQIEALEACVRKATMSEHMEKPIAVLAETLDQLVALRNCSDWDAICRRTEISYGTLRFSAKCTDTDLIAQIKAVRDGCKKGLPKKLRSFCNSSAQVLSDMQETMGAVRGLVKLTKRFAQEYDKMKQSRRILDFNDLEHKMLDLLLGRTRSGTTVIATEIGRRFREVMVDEYQDSNAVQDAIFGALTQERQNCFMVGDVKQSIYQFRLADPGIFLEKYNTFADADNAAILEGRKVLLSKNFRSSKAVIDAVNDVFTLCMSPQVGGLVYSDQEKLSEGIPHEALPDNAIELYGVRISEDTYAEEAAFVAQRIHQLIDGSHMIRDGQAFRPVRADDIVILLRSPGSVGSDFQYALEQYGIRCNTGGSSDLLQSEEIEVLWSLLQTINNPLNDIPLVSVLSSRIFCFTADELAQFRSANRRVSVYDALLASNMPKAKDFLDILSTLRYEAKMNSLTQLLSRIFALTRMDSIYASLSDGTTRVENLQSFCQLAAGFEETNASSLTHFLEHLATLSDRGLVVSGEDKSSGAVTIMSIHKSKGLEFPVVFLCGLSRAFNKESARAAVLCDKELGLGLGCIDSVNRVRYPTIAKRAIAAKILSEGLSEEMRVLYVAMTRAKDRLIMTYAASKPEEVLENIRARLVLSNPLLLTTDADCPGMWVLTSALNNAGGNWLVQLVQAPSVCCGSTLAPTDPVMKLSDESIKQMKESLSFSYLHTAATKVPSKQTATQLKGRDKDNEAAQNTTSANRGFHRWRKPSFLTSQVGGVVYGNAIHTVLQHIRYESCTSYNTVQQELNRLVDEGFLSKDHAAMVDPQKIINFFATEIGQKILSGATVLREFKFSILEDVSAYYPVIEGEQILLQGVVDCALIESDGITVIDFKTDQVTTDTMDMVTKGYAPQIRAYAKALSRIYDLPIKSSLIYYFYTDTFVSI